MIGRSLAATLPFLLLSPALLQVWGEFGYDMGTGQPPSELELQTIHRRCFTITEKVHARAFSW